MIDKFISEIKNRGLARTNRYEVKVSIPSTTSKGDQLVSVFCDAVNLPGLSVATQPSRMYGEVREMPYEPIYEPVTLSFYVDSNMEVKKAFDRWMASIVNVNTREMMYYDDYVRDVTIKVINRDYTPAPQTEQLNTERSIETDSPYIVVLSEAYPKLISTIQMDAGSKDVMKFSVLIQYKYWRAEGSSEMLINIPSKTPQRYEDPAGTSTGQGYQVDVARDAAGTGNPMGDISNYGGGW